MASETKSDNPTADVGCAAFVLLGFFVLLLVWLPTTSPMRTRSLAVAVAPTDTPTPIATNTPAALTSTNTPLPPQPSATPSPAPPTATREPSSPTPLPPTNTSVPPTSTPESASAAEAADSTSLVSAYDPEVVEQGQTLFVTCSACHGVDARGLPNLGKDLVASEFVGGLSDADLLTFVKTGRPVWDSANTTGVDMPPKGGNPAFTDDQLLSIIAYIRTLRAG